MVLHPFTMLCSRLQYLISTLCAEFAVRQIAVYFNLRAAARYLRRGDRDPGRKTEVSRTPRGLGETRRSGRLGVERGGTEILFGNHYLVE